MTRVAWWRFDFYDESGGLTGSTYVDGADYRDAISRSWALRCNPGGPVEFDRLERKPEISQEDIRRFIPRAELEAA
jgi:hypothetical protein